MATPSEEEMAFRSSIDRARSMFRQMKSDRHDYGQLKYGEFTFVEAPTMQMCLEELADLSNYAEYTAIKIVLLKEALERAQMQMMQKSGGASGGFVSVRNYLGLEGEGD